MRFSKLGPDLPIDLVNQSLKGEVIFLCGAGVSKVAGLPLFGELVKDIFDGIAEVPTNAEQRAISNGRYEEAVGALARRIANPATILDAVAKSLETPPNADLSAHRAILRISRDLEGRPCVVTTNFDTLFERVLLETIGAEKTASLSFAGAQLPTPGGPRFHGVMHLHGRLADEKISSGIRLTDLVLTSAEYGDAYLRFGWAGRFLFDLARSKKIVIVGYQADDPPVRYILNILEADRERFPDLNTVYALAGDNGQEYEAASAPWQTIAVEPIIYPGGGSDHSTLWHDLTQWAALAENPPKWRVARLTELLAKPVQSLESWEIDQAKWLLGSNDGVSTFLGSTCGADWIQFIKSSGLLQPNGDYDWALGKWLSARLTSTDAFKAIVEVADKLGTRTSDLIQISMLPPNNAPDVPQYLDKGWRLLAWSLRDRTHPEDWKWLGIERQLKLGKWLADDLNFLVDLITPRLMLKPHGALEKYAGIRDDPSELADLCSVEMKAPGEIEIERLSAAVKSDSTAISDLLHRAVSSLINALSVARDAGLTGGRMDRPSLDVASISEHERNDYAHGFTDLVRLVVDLWEKLVSDQPEIARTQAQRLSYAGFTLTDRIWLHLLRSSLFEPDLAISVLLTLDDDGFWILRREVALLMRTRAGVASGPLSKDLLERILKGPPAGESDGDDETKAHHRLFRTRMYLHFLAEAGGEVGRTAKDHIDEIVKRDPRLVDPPEEDDLLFMRFFSRTDPQGDPEPVKNADVDERLEIVAQLEANARWDHSDTWQMYCADDPAGAIDALIAKPPKRDIWPRRWTDALAGLTAKVRQLKEADPKAGTTTTSVERAFDHLRNERDNELHSLLWYLVDLWVTIEEKAIDLDKALWDRLWHLAESSLPRPGADNADGRDESGVSFASVGDALNSPAGKLAFAELRQLDRTWNRLTGGVRACCRTRLQKMIASNTISGFHAKMLSVEHIHWVNLRFCDLVDESLASALSEESTSGKILRDVLVSRSQLVSPELKLKLREPMLRGVRDHKGKGILAQNAASRVVWEMLARYDSTLVGRPALSAKEARLLLRQSSEEIRIGAASILGSWLISEDKKNRGNSWKDRYGPAFCSLWPQDRRFQTEATSRQLAELAVAASDEFPVALVAIGPFLVPLVHDEWPHLFYLEPEQAGEVLAKYPHEVVSLLWALLKPPAKGRCSSLPKILDKILEVAPALANDRRFQQLRERELRV